MPQGEYVAIFSLDEEVAVYARQAGLQFRDTLLVLGPGKTSSFILLFKAPTEGTFLDNLLKHEVGALNIRDCRIKCDLTEFFSATGKPRSGMGHAKGYGMGDGYGGDKANPPDKGGRWPTNLVFVHSPGCRIVGTREVTTGVAHRTNSGGKTFGGNSPKPAMADMTYGGADGKETIPAYQCDDDCLVAAIDRQSGNRPSTLTGRGDPKVLHEHPSSAHTDSWFTSGAAKASGVYADFGGASRFYPQFLNTKDLLEWVEILIGGATHD